MKTALISVSDKTNIEKLASFFIQNNISILSTGGTYTYLKNKLGESNITEISDYTGFCEILDGRVKSLHPKVHGGILAVESNEKHMKELEKYEICKIDYIIVNLYPFKETIKKSNNLSDAIENIDIGGHSLIRAGSKNFEDVLVVTNPDDYEDIINHFEWIDSNVRRKFAEKAFTHILQYDAAIATYFDKDLDIRIYNRCYDLKYGCNPQQKSAAIYKNIITVPEQFPFDIINGVPGYINILDAIYAWNLVSELSFVLKLPAAASFKHTSPAGAAIYSPLSDDLKKIYGVSNYELTETAIAFIRARNADPMCSYGDFIAISHKIDVETAKLISIEVSDGIIAPEYDKEALEILRKKKNGNYIILIGKEYKSEIKEVKELHGVVLIQDENKNITNYNTLENVVTKNNEITNNAKRDLILANTTLKYTQSNSVAFAIDGQCIGIGAGQQSRIDCVKLAKRKAETWYLRSHPNCISLYDKFKAGVKRQVKINAIIKYIDGEFNKIEYENWLNLFEIPPQTLTNDDKNKYLETLSEELVLASDAFFPFRDNIDCAAKIGTKYILQPGGSIMDDDVIKAADEYDMAMIFSGIDMRMFLH